MSVGVREMAKKSVANTSPLAERLCQSSTARRLFAPTIADHALSRTGVSPSSIGESQPAPALRDCPSAYAKPEESKEEQTRDGAGRALGHRGGEHVLPGRYGCPAATQVRSRSGRCARWNRYPAIAAERNF